MAKRSKSFDEAKILARQIYRDDFESVPDLIRAFVGQCDWLTQTERDKIMEEMADEIADIDQFARDQTLRRPEVLLG